MNDILLATLNARFIHAAFGLRYLFANLGDDLRPRAAISEFDINQKPLDIAETILAHNPKILGLGVYIWNATQSAELVAILKRVRPQLTIILGGPEVSYETADQPIVHAADYVITGEADLKFAEVAAAILRNEPPAQKIIPAEIPDLARLALPYAHYDSRDVAHRVIYVEASRGCPFTCEFCLSSLDIPVRQVPLEPFLAAMSDLLARGVKHFKFVDRTFNLSIPTSRAILEFFLKNWPAPIAAAGISKDQSQLLPLPPGEGRGEGVPQIQNRQSSIINHQSPNPDDLFLHFEMIPDRLPVELRELIEKFPPGALQFEVGIQTFNPEVGARIKRRQNYARLEKNFAFLRARTGVHIHADLIAGLPGETLESFAAGFDRLIALRPQEIQVGILKRLRGTPIIRHDAEFQMTYRPEPPYEILSNNTLDFQTLQRLRRFARFWDLLGNSGNFIATTPLLWSNHKSPFQTFLAFTDHLYAELKRTHEIPLNTLAEELFIYLARTQEAAEALASDFARTNRDLPPFLNDQPTTSTQPRSGGKRSLAKRQQRRVSENFTPSA